MRGADPISPGPGGSYPWLRYAACGLVARGATSLTLHSHTHRVSRVKSPSPRHLSDLLNLSFALAENLRRVGIRTPAELVATGAEAAWQALHQGGYVDSAQSLLALEGAIHGVPWRELAPERRHELMHFFHAVTDWTAGCREGSVAA